jgi:hypothetical protein
MLSSDMLSSVAAKTGLHSVHGHGKPQLGNAISVRSLDKPAHLGSDKITRSVARSVAKPRGLGEKEHDWVAYSQLLLACIGAAGAITGAIYTWKIYKKVSLTTSLAVLQAQQQLQNASGTQGTYSQ